ncbi:integrase [Enterovibrio sp. ZSDZ42]|uniref:Integrase n=1 Tax=Enterovibrio gelatinilyticus TaxID=2899819 RepID=A0ABT5R7L6_9GAMM|nr:integrase [Enterovibrio sp. ZSDZ42]MDD1796267.1 integrase [Enterovibrio sp. ZSDZ42]
MRVLLDLPGNVLDENQNGYYQVVELYENKNFKQLNEVVVTKDYSGKAASYFGDQSWNLSAYIDRKIANKSYIAFYDIKSPELADELKLICFSWLYTPSGRTRSSPLKPSTIIALHSKLLQVYKFLDRLRLGSIALLSHPVLFCEFCNHINELRYSLGNTMQIFSALKKVERSSKYLPIRLIMPTDQSSVGLAKEHCCPTKNTADQFYAIPTQIMEKIYAHSISFVEELHPHRELLSDLARDLRKNYEMGEKFVDRKIESGTWKWLNKESPEYRIEVNKAKPMKYRDIIDSYLCGTQLEKYRVAKEGDIRCWLTKILVTCYLACAAFTGMRKNELYGLHADSFKSRSFNGKTIHTLQSTHHKMTQGRGNITEWVTSPISRKAIELAEAVSRNMREQLLLSFDPMKNYEASCLWLSQSKKSKPPKVFDEYNLRCHFKFIAKEAGAIIDERALDEFKLINPNRNPLHAEQKISIGKPWPLTSHQLRRTFAVFVRRHNLCSLIAVKDQFKHLDIPTSDWYGQGSNAASLQSIEMDQDLKLLIEEVADEVTTDNFYRWFNSSEKLYGKRGIEIMKERNQIPQDLKSWDEIKEQVKAGRLTMVGTLHSYCLAGYECRMDKVTSPANCFKCENQLIDEEKAQHWVQRHKWTTEQVIYLDSINRLSLSAQSHYITQIRATERVMHYFKIPFERFDEFGEDNG